MLETVKKYVEAGFEKLSSRRAEEMARSLVKQGQATRDQAARLAGDLREWSKRNAERLRDVVSREVREQVGKLGLARQSEVDALRKRVRELEQQVRSRASGGPSKAKGGAKRSSTKASSTKTSSAKRSSAKGSSSKRSSPSSPGPG